MSSVEAKISAFACHNKPVKVEKPSYRVRQGKAVKFTWGKEERETRREAALNVRDMEQVRSLGQFGRLRLSPTESILKDGQIVSLDGLAS